MRTEKMGKLYAFLEIKWKLLIHVVYSLFWSFLIDLRQQFCFSCIDIFLIYDINNTSNLTLSMHSNIFAPL